MLDAEGGDGDLAGVGGQDVVGAEGAVLFAAADDVAGLDVDVAVGDVFDLEFVDVGDFVDEDFLFLEGFLEGQVGLGAGAVLAVDEEDVEIAVGVGSGDAVIADGHGGGRPG